MRKNMFGKVFALAAAGVIVLTGLLPVTTVTATGKQEQEVDLDGTYHARMGIQTSSNLWIMQMNYYKGQSNETLGTDLENKLYCADQSGSDKLVSKEGDFDEVEISGNGVYTVNLENANFDGETEISQLHVATDIPLNDKIKFTNVKVKVNGREFVTFDEAVMEDEEPYLEGGMVILAMNHWRSSVVGYLKEHGCSESGTNGWQLLSGQGGENISITFTVSGFNKDNPDAVEATPTPKADTSTQETGEDEDSDVQSTSTSNSMLAVAGGAAVIAVIVVVLVIVRRKKK